MRYIQLKRDELEFQFEQLLQTRNELKRKVDEDSAYTKEQCEDRLNNMISLNVIDNILTVLGVGIHDREKYVGDSKYKCGVAILENTVTKNELIEIVNKK